MMQKKLVFRSARATWISLATLLPAVIGVVFIFSGPWFFAFLFIPVIVITLSVCFRTFYTLHDFNRLTVVCGFLYKKTFNVNEIVRVRPSRNVISSPALSLNRLELTFRNNEKVLISPVRKEEFIAAQQMVNPGIEVKTKEF